MFGKKKQVQFLTPKGKCFYTYLLNKKNGSNEYIEAYEDSIKHLMEHGGVTEEEAINTYLYILKKSVNI